MKPRWFKKVGIFFVGVYLISALLWVPVLISGAGLTTTSNKILVGLFTFTPSLLGILFVYMTKDREGRQDFWKRVLRWPRGHTGYAAAALLLPPFLALSAYFLSSLISGIPIRFEYAGEMLKSPVLMIQFLVVELFFGAVSEELGWRGYALDELQSRWNALTSSLILGIIWACWHLPAFFVPGLSQYEMRSLPNILLFTANVILACVIQTWGYNNTGRSILVGGILMHFLSNAAMIFTNGIFERYAPPPSYAYVQAGLGLLTVILIVAIWKPAHLARDPNPKTTAAFMTTTLRQPGRGD